MLMRMLALALVAPLVLLAACGDDDDDSATNTPGAATTAAGGAATTAAGGAATTAAAGPDEQDVSVTAVDFSFSTASITASEGETLHVTLTNNDSAPHSFTVGSTDVTEAEGGAEATGDYIVQAGDTEFHCKYHSTMTGTITVN